MYKTEEELEKNIFYRIIKIGFIFALLVIIGFAFLFASDEVPREIIDKEFIHCADGRIYDIDKVREDCGPWLYVLSENSMRALCYYKPPTKCIDIEKGVSLSILGNKENFEVEYTYKTYGSWGQAISIFLKIIIVGYIILFILKKTLIYIAFGKKQPE